MARWNLFLVLLTSALFLSACSDERTRQLNRTSKRIIDAAKNGKQTMQDGLRSLKEMEAPEAPEMPTTEDLSAAGDAFVETLSTKTAEKVADKLSSKFDSSVDGVKDTYSDTERAVERTTNSARAKVRWIVRRTPRSQREANQMAEAYGREWIEEFQAYLDSVAQKGQFRVDKRADEKRAR